MDYLKQVFSEFGKNRCSTLAAALAFYTAFALPPLLYLLLWVYYTSMIVLLGAEATQVYAVMYGKGVCPERDAVHVVRQTVRDADSSQG
ncbi:MAG: hypothetical protein KDB00_09330 [Planctomycetales bacterium]|nr:hypothetical protein [Planctomycetales bacterium]